MYVILTKDVPQVGQKNALVRVADGYFQNFLQPRGLASKAHESDVSRYESHLKLKKDKASSQSTDHEQLLAKMRGLTVVFTRKTSEKGTLYKALHEKDISKALQAQHGLEISDSAIVMEALKTLGAHQVQVKLGSASASLSVDIQKSDE